MLVPLIRIQLSKYPTMHKTKTIDKHEKIIAKKENFWSLSLVEEISKTYDRLIIMNLKLNCFINMFVAGMRYYYPRQ